MRFRVWSDRFTIYYSRDTRYAVRWLKPGCPEETCEPIAGAQDFRHQPGGFVKFANKVDAERFYNELLEHHPTWRIEVFWDQAQWVCYASNRRSTGELKTEPIGESRQCLAGRHGACENESCSCHCHSTEMMGPGEYSERNS